MKGLKDYSFIKGVNYEYGRKSEQEWLTELTWAKRIGLNSLRIWLDYPQYKKDPAAYLRYVKHFFQLCHQLGFTIMPIIFNANAIQANNPYLLREEFLPDGEAYVRDVTAALRDEPALLMYDVMNEPGCNHLIWDAKDETEKKHWMDRHWAFVKHFCEYVKHQDPQTAITVGCWLAVHVEETAPWVDVLSYHDYSPSTDNMIRMAQTALDVAQKYDKPVMNTETGCVGRGNPYDVTIRVMNERNIPWYIYGLTCDGYWQGIHGIFYTDGTVRDPAALAAVMGFYRNTDYETLIPENPNREKLVTATLNKLRPLLQDSTNDCFNYQGVSVEQLLEVCSELVNFLEGNQLVPMRIPPTARLNAFRRQEHPNLLEVKAFAYEMAKILKESCQIL